MKRKFIAYYRVSTGKQGLDGNGMESQKQTVERYVASQDGQLVCSFCELESGKVNQRPQLALALQLAKSERATLVIAKLDRLSRNAAFLLQLQDSGTEFVCCDCPQASRLHLSILAIFAQQEREMISQRTKAGLAVAKQRGARLGNPRLHLARQNAMATVAASKKAYAESILPVIRDIQSAGVTTLSGLATCLNKRGERGARGGVWTATAVRNLLKQDNGQG